MFQFFPKQAMVFLDVLLLQDPARALARPGMGGAEEGEALGGSEGLDSTWISIRAIEKPWRTVNVITRG
jgi:hypothetical protein